MFTNENSQTVNFQNILSLMDAVNRINLRISSQQSKTVNYKMHFQNHSVLVRRPRHNGTLLETSKV